MLTRSRAATLPLDVTNPQLDLELHCYPTDRLPPGVLDDVKLLFAENYRDANLAYLEKSVTRLGFLSIARAPDGTPAGFALGETRLIDLPRLPGAIVRLAGVCCVSPAFRRHRLFGALEGLAIGARSELSQQRVRQLSTGRMAHPASFRGMSANPSAVPRRGVTPTAWQQEVGIAIAEAYGSPGFDPLTFRVHGSGVPIGWPIIEIEATPEEWEPFATVDRSKGDSLLGISWGNDPPPGWNDP